MIFKSKKEKRRLRHRRSRKKVAGTAERPRLSVCFTSKHIYVQLIDDDTEKTLASISSLDPEFVKGKHKTGIEGAGVLGKVLGQRAAEKGIKKVVFDRGGFKFHGRVKALADAARESGLQF